MKDHSQPPLRFVLQTSQAVFDDGAMRQITVEARDGYAVLRLRGSKLSYAVPWTAIYRAAAVRAAERELRRKKAWEDE